MTMVTTPETPGNVPDLAVNLGGLAMKNPVTVASGTFGYGSEYGRYFDISLLGAVTTKSITLKPRAGNRPPRLVETPSGILNAIGLQNVGIDAYLADKAPYLRSMNVPVIANIHGNHPDHYAELASRLQQANAADAIEINLSCPNVHDARNARGAVLVGQDCDAVARYVHAVRAEVSLPVLAKLTPNVTDIRETALAAQEAGADAVSLINTLSGMAIDTETRRPKLANLIGGLSGPAIRPVAVKMVWDAAQVLHIPILAMGGICHPEDAIEFILAGATAVAVGSMSFRQPDAAIRVVHGIEQYLIRHGLQSVYDLRGAVRLPNV